MKKPFKIEEIAFFVFIGYWLIAFSTPAWSQPIISAGGAGMMDYVSSAIAITAAITLAALFTLMVYRAEKTAQRIRTREAIEEQQQAPQGAPQVGKY